MEDNYDEFAALVDKMAISERWDIIFEHFTAEELNTVFGAFFDAIIKKIDEEKK